MNEADDNWDLAAAESAYVVISRYVEHAQVSGFIIAMLAGALGEEKLEFLVNSEHWQNYLASKRELESSKEDIENLASLIERLRA